MTALMGSLQNSNSFNFRERGGFATRTRMPQEIVLTTSSAPESLVLLHDLHTSNHIQSFRQSATAANGLTVHPSNSLFLAAQVDKGIVHVYAWGKDTVNTKMILPEKIRSLQISPSGTWCVGGSESGRLFLWEVVPSLVPLADGRSRVGTCYLPGKHIINHSLKHVSLQTRRRCLQEETMLLCILGSYLIWLIRI